MKTFRGRRAGPLRVLTPQFSWTGLEVQPCLPFSPSFSSTAPPFSLSSIVKRLPPRYSHYHHPNYLLILINNNNNE
ncbi:hypothetical protein E2C01_022917 [Portunus trituberculatus]|uniref:Uncharacterized protein n=1 Tax=Portunus trituberculatus TaxID=210409 RepID=A0A5B7E6P7_PORTR|nr:hypothetical protein [Portunus trituberculatus]